MKQIYDFCTPEQTKKVLGLGAPIKSRIPSPNHNSSYQYLCIQCHNNGCFEYNTNSINDTINAFEKNGWVYKGKGFGISV